MPDEDGEMSDSETSDGTDSLDGGGVDGGASWQHVSGGWQFGMSDGAEEIGTPIVVGVTKVGWCRLTVPKPVLKAPVISAIETIIWMKWFELTLSNSACAATLRL
jgi:hypothetical protein